MILNISKHFFIFYVITFHLAVIIGTTLLDRLFIVVSTHINPTDLHFILDHSSNSTIFMSTLYIRPFFNSSLIQSRDIFQIARQQFDSRMAVLQAGINRIRSDSLSRSVNNLNNRVSVLRVYICIYWQK